MNDPSQMELYPRIPGQMVSSRFQNATLLGKVISTAKNRFTLLVDEQRNIKVQVIMEESNFPRKPVINDFLEIKARCLGDRKVELVSYVFFSTISKEWRYADLENYNETVRLMNGEFAHLFICE